MKTTTIRRKKKKSTSMKRIFSEVNGFCCDDADEDGITEDVEESTERSSTSSSGLEGKGLSSK